jgi:hypothetical protein
MEFIVLNDTNAKHWSGIAVFAIRIAGGSAALGCFFAGLWSVWGNPGRGISLMALGIVLGVVFGRYPACATAALAHKKTDAG